MSVPHARFNSATGEVSIGDLTCTLRPKTFLLAQYLAERSHQVISKEELLCNIWKDNIVEDQAVFQSVNEIRKAFPNFDVIKTHPRRGYAWQIEAEPITAISSATDAEIASTQTGGTEQTGLLAAFANKPVLLILAALIVTVTIHAFWYIQQPVSDNDKYTTTSSAAHQALLVLPFDTSKLDNNMHWLKYGALDAVIHKFSNQKATTVFQPEDVLDILNRKPHSLSTPAALFEVSGATLIVDGQLSGVPGDYIISFTLYDRQSQQHDVLHAMTLEALFEQIAQRIEAKLALPLSAERLSFDKQFNNTLMFNAIQLLAAGDAASATAFLESARVALPKQPDSYFWLARAYIAQNTMPQALTVLDQLLSLPDLPKENLMYSRALYLKGSALFSLGNPDSFAALTDALQASQNNEDWLYVAYAKSLLAHVYISRQQSADALPLLQQALAYQQMLQCPMGIAQSYLDFVDYYLTINNMAMAQSSFQQAEKLVSTKQLTLVKPLISEYRSRIENH